LLDKRQKGILLRLVEAMHFIDEQDRVPPRLRQRRLGPRDRVANILDARKHCGQRDELGVERIAISRASVVLPTPGGPHRIIECGLPDANATASGLPGASRCRWPMTSSIVLRPAGARRAALPDSRWRKGRAW
jgi:hypothetical protein